MCLHVPLVCCKRGQQANQLCSCALNCVLHPFELLENDGRFGQVELSVLNRCSRRWTAAHGNGEVGSNILLQFQRPSLYLLFGRAPLSNKLLASWFGGYLASTARGRIYKCWWRLAESSAEGFTECGPLSMLFVASCSSSPATDRGSSCSSNHALQRRHYGPWR